MRRKKWGVFRNLLISGIEEAFLGGLRYLGGFFFWLSRFVQTEGEIEKSMLARNMKWLDIDCFFFATSVLNRRVVALFCELLWC